HTFVPQFPEQLRRLNTDSKTTTIQHLAVPGLGEFIDVASPILAGRAGCVHVGMDQSLIQANIRSSILQQAGLMSLILFLGILAAYVLVQRISQPLRRLTEYANKMAATDAANVRSLFLSGESLSNSDRDEVGQLSLAFRKMVHEICIREENLVQAGATIRRREAHFRSLIENVTDVIAKLGEDGTVSYASPSLQRALGYQPEEWVGRSFFGFMVAEEQEAARLFVFQAPEWAGPTSPMEFRFRHKDGSARVVEVIVNHLVDDPEVQGIVVNLRDIT